MSYKTPILTLYDQFGHFHGVKQRVDARNCEVKGTPKGAL